MVLDSWHHYTTCIERLSEDWSQKLLAPSVTVASLWLKGQKNQPSNHSPNMYSDANNRILTNIKFKLQTSPAIKNLQVETPGTDDKKARRVFLPLLFVYTMYYIQIGVEEKDGKMVRIGRRNL